MPEENSANFTFNFKAFVFTGSNISSSQASLVILYSVVAFTGSQLLADLYDNCHSSGILHPP